MKERTERIAKIVGEKMQAEAMVVEVEKNNRTRHGVSIQSGDNARAVFYIDDMEEMSEEEVADKIVEVCSKEEMPIFDLTTIVNKEFVLEHVIPCMVGRSGNEKFLQNLVHTPFLDLEIVYRVMISDDYSGSFLLRNAMLQDLHISKTELEEKAQHNLIEKDHTKVASMTQILSELSGIPIEMVEEKSLFPMYVMTNQNKMFGANSILRKDLLKELSEELGKDLYIFPSSIQEIILVPEDNTTNTMDLKEIVRLGNINTVSAEEKLSDSVYHFNRVTEEIEVMA